MLRISSSTISEWNGKSVEVMAIELTQFLREKFPAAHRYRQRTFEQAVLARIHEAVGFGFTTEQNVATFVLCSWVLGSNFTRGHDHAREILANRDVPETDRASALESYVFARLKSSE